MDWNNNSDILKNSSSAFVSCTPEISSASNLLYNINQLDSFPGLEVIKHQCSVDEMMGSNIVATPSMGMGRDMIMMSFGNNQEKMKRRLTTNQLESLESSFQEERKLDPDRKMKLARELGLQPRQVAVWFQNRRARWKAKKLEYLYDALKLEFENVSKEKQKLQDEVLKLKSMLMQQATKKQVYNYTEASCEETVESTSVAIPNSDHHKNASQAVFSRGHNNKEGHHLFNVDDYNAVSPCYWGAFA
ncbi:hypothetical protein BVRB_7g160720 isoform A [Beta vulgaris subsp. vulgaris]|nr:hypothetical protein BVRB_7g160720 isoform A [Beta vulgaris subsp. vulgaris]